MAQWAEGVEHISSTPEWRGFESRWFYQSGFEFAKTSVAVVLVVR